MLVLLSPTGLVLKVYACADDYNELHGDEISREMLRQLHGLQESVNHFIALYAANSQQVGH